MPEVKQAKEYSAMQPQTIEINTPERVTLRKQITKELYDLGSYNGVDKNGKPLYNGIIDRNKRVDIVIGLPAAGKSSVFVDPISQKYHSRVIDSDMAKERLPEFKNGLGAGAVHEESSAIVKDFLMKQAVKNGDNIVYPIVGGNIGSVLHYIEAFKDKGYSVNVHLNELPNHKAVARVTNRFYTDNRFVDPDIVLKAGNKPTEVYKQLRAMEGLLDGYSHFSNDVERGQRPIQYETTLDLWQVDTGRIRGHRTTSIPARNEELRRRTGTSGETTKVIPRKIPRKEIPRKEIPYKNNNEYGKNTVGSAESNPNSFYALTNKHGTIKPGEIPARVVDVPKKTQDNNKVRQFTRTMMEAKGTPDFMIPIFEKAVENHDFSYEPISNDYTIKKASAKINNQGLSTSFAEWNNLVREKPALNTL